MEPGDEPDADARAFVGYLNRTVANLPDYDQRDVDGKKSKGGLSAVLKARDEFLANLRETASDFIDGSFVLDCLEATARKTGEFEGKVSAIQQDNVAVTVWRDLGSDVDDIRLNTNTIDLSEDQQKLLIELQKALTVVEKALTVVATVRLFRSLSTAELRRRSEVARRNYYVGKLAEIARYALIGAEKVGYAVRQLEAFKNEFVALEADQLKNRYIRKLGQRAAVYGAVFFGAYWFSRYIPFAFDAPDAKNFDPNTFILYRYKEFFCASYGRLRWHMAFFCD
jgi:hypothetical protein